ncbi:exopolysaccharide biosynthesis protein [Aureimonas sp. Leaf454]|uniref:sugar transferase n=1 Tax=Aureimonas sp. Leaf454 TaxID=1736381 RepID=UPI000702007C|nr:sugar transferase [Aureimonas sp. Leaf454]KQT51000.1 exopolysaccharide biosynthesis protein [Aureimonas sp. Leaf454]
MNNARYELSSAAFAPSEPSLSILYRSASAAEPTSVIGDWRKRALDVTLSAAGLLVLAPLLILLALLVRLSSPGGAVYGHKRVGLGGKTFKCLKFRTMVSNGDEVLRAHLAENPQAHFEWESSRKLRKDPRVTAIGAFLRKTSLDELPQIINILRGDMSIVGPRPVVEDELRYYGPYVGHYFAARPGLTGLWQVSGRSDTSYDARVAFDRTYCETWSFNNDIAIIVKTVPAVLACKGTY